MKRRSRLAIAAPASDVFRVTDEACQLLMEHLLDRAHAHREVKLIEDTPHRLSGRSPCQVGKDRLTVTNHGHFLARTPTLRPARRAKCRSDLRTLQRERKATQLAGLPLHCPLSRPDFGFGDRERRGCGRRQSSPRLLCSVQADPRDPQGTNPGSRWRPGWSDCVSSHGSRLTIVTASTAAVRHFGMSAER
jgi:hypothetical protein